MCCLGGAICVYSVELRLSLHNISQGVNLSGALLIQNATGDSLAASRYYRSNGRSRRSLAIHQSRSSIFFFTFSTRYIFDGNVGHRRVPVRGQMGVNKSGAAQWLLHTIQRRTIHRYRIAASTQQLSPSPGDRRDITVSTYDTPTYTASF